MRPAAGLSVRIPIYVRFAEAPASFPGTVQGDARG